jgi:hypothetical protein
MLIGPSRGVTVRGVFHGGVMNFQERSRVSSGVVIDPEITRDVSLATIAGRRFSPAVATFVRAVQSFKWPSQSA